MTVLDLRPAPNPRYILRQHRRHEIVTIGGVGGVLQVAAALADLPVRDFAVDVREGVMYSSITCTVSVTDDECRWLVDRLLAVPTVVSVSPC